MAISATADPTQTPTKVALVGASGRIGRVIDRVVSALPGFEIASRLDSTTGLGDAAYADLIIDVTRFDVSEALVRAAVLRGQKVLVGTSGWSAEHIAELQPMVQANPAAGVLIIPNFSIGSMLATKLAETAATVLQAIDIVEEHHAEKLDSPSGTAKRTAELLEAQAHLQPGSIPIHSIRLPGIVAKQTVTFGAPGETVAIVHETTSNESYEQGIAAATVAATGLTGLAVGLESVIKI